MKLLTKNLRFKTLAITGLLAFACTKVEKEEKIVEVEVEKQVVKAFDLAQPASLSAQQVQNTGTEMFTDADNAEADGQIILYNDDLRSFRVNEMLEIRAIEGSKFRIRNFVPHTFTNLEVFMEIKGFKAPVKVAVFEEFPSLFEYIGDLPFSDDETFFENSNGETISVENIKKLSINDLKFTLESTDPMLAKLKSIKMSTFYCFRHYKNDQKWDKVTAEDARNYLPLVANMAFMFSSDEFENDVKNAPYEFENVKGKPLDREQIIKNFRNVPRQNLGIIVYPSNLGGLGGGNTFGVRREYINNAESSFYTKSDVNAPWRTKTLHMNVWIHEFGHVAGYGHDGNMTYFYGPSDTQKFNRGIVPVGMALYQKLLLEGKLPFNKYPYKK